MTTIDIIAFDADDTLWHTERLYRRIEARFQAMLAPYAAPDVIARTMHHIEIANLPHYGYGIKGFILSLAESAVELSGGRIAAQDVRQVICWAKEMASAPVELFDHSADVVARLAASYPLMLITKGDLLDQQAKIDRSGLRSHFRHIEIVTDKTQETYAAILARHGLAAERFLMVGNSLRSDVVPVIRLGGWAVHIPYDLTWEHEVVELSPDDRQRVIELEHIGLLPGLIERLAGSPRRQRLYCNKVGGD